MPDMDRINFIMHEQRYACLSKVCMWINTQYQFSATISSSQLSVRDLLSKRLFISAQEELCVESARFRWKETNEREDLIHVRFYLDCQQLQHESNLPNLSACCIVWWFKQKITLICPGTFMCFLYWTSIYVILLWGCYVGDGKKSVNRMKHFAPNSIGLPQLHLPHPSCVSWVQWYVQCQWSWLCSSFNYVIDTAMFGENRR